MKDIVSNNLLNLRNILFKKGKMKETFLASNLLKNYISDPEYDKGKKPWVTNIEELTMDNENFRTTEWTGTYFQMTVMSLEPGEDIGLEAHNDVDQFIRIERGNVEVVMGPDKDNLDQTWEASDDFAIFIPAGTWHNITNTGDTEVKLYSIYASPEHPPGTIHETKEEAEEYELEHHS